MTVSNNHRERAIMNESVVENNTKKITMIGELEELCNCDMIWTGCFEIVRIPNSVKHQRNWLLDNIEQAIIKKLYFPGSKSPGYETIKYKCKYFMTTYILWISNKPLNFRKYKLYYKNMKDTCFTITRGQHKMPFDFLWSKQD